MSLAVVNLSKAAERIDRPFALVTLGLLGDLSVNLYMCQGRLDWHKHVDEDELFLVHEGMVQLETERGPVTLHPEECAVVPKGIRHRSGSALRSVVLLVRAQVFSERKNGHRRLHATTDDPRMEKFRLSRALAEPTVRDFDPIPITGIEAFGLTVQRAKGAGPRLTTPRGGALLFSLRGAALVETSGGGARLEMGELVLLPSEEAYTLSAPETAVVVRLQAVE